jgi:uncharacterized protein
VEEDRPTNRLARETSPYLLQHAHNPVDWYPWGTEALKRARDEDKPILLSIGYAACHWCHVMESESFEDEATARLMNERFVSIKVDREERPDLDSIYMDAVQAMTGSGGWPMTVFLTPDGTPFYAGTYFPKEDRHGLPAFTKVLSALAEVWRDRRAEVVEQGRKVVSSISQRTAFVGSTDPLGEEVLLAAHTGLGKFFDPVNGGFGGAPKFPQPMTLEFLLRCHLRGYPDSLEMVERTLDRMAGGGVYDQLGGGFHRYSVDDRWHVPHFEKMLYDNAQLARLYTRAWQVSGHERYRRVADETLGYLLREMRHPDGGFFSSQDADSEGEEGKFFAWTWDEMLGLVGEPVARHFGASPHGNWEQGKNVLWTPSPGELDEGARRVLFEAREGRVPPATDDKVLAAWNGMAISAFAEAGRVLGREDLVQAAKASADFVLARMRDGTNRLLRSWRDGNAGRPGYLDDYALMSDACLTLYETTFDSHYFLEARQLADEMLRLFRDDEGGFFQTGSDAETLVIRPKELFDNAVPSGNSVAAMVLQRLALFTGEAGYESAASSALKSVRDLMPKVPTMFGQALSALDLYLSRSKEVAIVGDPAHEDTRALVAEVQRKFRPNVVLAVGSAKDGVPLLAERIMKNGNATAYVCERFACQMPVTEPEALAAQL